jgi:hypothetical protein
MTFYKTLLAATLAILAIALLPSCNLDKPVTRQEALDLAAKIERSVAAHNATFLNSMWDQQRFSQRVLAEAHQRFNLSMAKDARNALTEAQWGQKILSGVTGGGYTLVHQYEKDGHQHLLFRLYDYSPAFNYHDYELVKTDNGVKVADAYIYYGGENLSRTVAQSLLLVTDKVSDLTPDDQQKVYNLRKIDELINGGNLEEAGQYYDKLPSDMKKQKLFQLIHLRITAKLGDSTYLAAINEYKSYFPRDPSLGVFMLDAYFMEKDYPSALGAVNRLDTAVQKDPFLDYYRGLIYKVEENPTQSRICLEKVHNYMPRFGRATVELLANYATSGSPDSAAMLVRQAQADSNITADQLKAIEEAYPTIRPYLK